MTLWYILFRIPWHILLIAATLVVVGALALYSASEGSWQPWAGRHALRGSVGVGVVLLMAFIDFKLVHRVVLYFIDCRADCSCYFAGDRVWPKCIALDKRWRSIVSTLGASQNCNYPGLGKIF